MANTVTYKRDKIYKSVPLPKTKGRGKVIVEATAPKRAGRPENPILTKFKAKAADFQPGDFLPLIVVNDEATIKSTLNTVRSSIDNFLKKSGLKDEGYNFTTNIVEGTSIVGVWRK